MKTSKNTQQDSQESLATNAEDAYRAKLEKLCKCDRIVSQSEIVDFGDISKFHPDDVIYDNDGCSKDAEAEFRQLTKLLDLPHDTHSLTKIEINLPPCLKYGFRSGRTHLNSPQFSPLTRGYQGPAIGLAAIATSRLIEPHCWNEPVIDRLIEDGDTYYSNSYTEIVTDDRRTLTILDLKRHLDVRGTHRIAIEIDDPIYAGTFRSETPKDLHVAKALDLFFKKYDTAVLTSPILNVAIWKSTKYFYIFDAQPRLENCTITDSEDGSAKLILVHELRGVLFFILQKSNVGNEAFVLYRITITDVRTLSSLPDDKPSLDEPRRRPSGYEIHDTFRATILGSYHILHPILPKEFHGNGHLTISVTAIIYSKLLNASKWTKVMVDLIFNQSNMYLTDLAQALKKTLDADFRLSVNDLLCDVFMGVYAAKIKVQENVIPGEGKKGKATMDEGIREFFETFAAGIIEIKNVYFPIWKEENKFYFFDPFPCDEEGFRVDPEEAEKYSKAKACITMNSSVDQLIETILENTSSKDKDPFIIHGLTVLYIKSGADERVVYREKHAKRRPQRVPTPPPVIDGCAIIVETEPKPKFELELPVDENSQYPELMNQIEAFMDTFIVDSKSNSNDENTTIELNRKFYRYRIVTHRKIMLRAGKNCLSTRYREPNRGKQGLTIAIVAIVQSLKGKAAEWKSYDLDKIIDDGNFLYEKVTDWVLRGSPGDFLEEEMNESKIEKDTDGDESKKDVDNLSRKTKSVAFHQLDNLEVSMLPKEVMIDQQIVKVNVQHGICKGVANPLANLGEALEQYFELSDQLILENNTLVYGIWRRNNKYFSFNPFGSDNDGWLNTQYSAALFVVDTIVELVNHLYGTLEFNDPCFILHFIKFAVPDEAGNEEIEWIPETYQEYLTKFLPVTNEDIEALQPGKKDAADTEMDDKLGETKEVSQSNLSRRTMAREKMSILCKYVKEPDQSDAPVRLNLALVTGLVKIQSVDEEEERQQNLLTYYEKLKYKHPPPFVIPPQKNVCDLLDAKLASNSAHSLISRFSIDSKLAIKEKTDLPSAENQDIIISHDAADESKLITLLPKKYFYSKNLPNGLTPIRAIDELYIRDRQLEEEQEEECRRKKAMGDPIMVSQVVVDPEKPLLPIIIPLGPCIRTPKFKRIPQDCPEKGDRYCPLSCEERQDEVLRKLVCSTENLFLEVLLPDFKCIELKSQSGEEEVPVKEHSEDESTVMGTVTQDSESCGFKATEDDDVGIITASTSLEDRESTEDKHYKSCYFSAILCILAKINLNVHDFRSSNIDQFILAANKISSGTVKLRCKMKRWLRNIKILGVKCNVIVKQVQYADPANFKPDALECVLINFLNKHQTGILIFQNVSYAFWIAYDMFYLFDSYPCDENGKASPDGNACLMKFCNFDAFFERILENTGETVDKPYRLYILSISHLEAKKKRQIKSRKQKRKTCKSEKAELEQAKSEVYEDQKLESEDSLVELVDWISQDEVEYVISGRTPGFVPIKNYKASVLEVEILENCITRLLLAPFKPEPANKPERQKVYDRNFYEKTILGEPMDLCLMAWSQIYEPSLWSTRTLKALFEACKEYTLDSILASEDTSMLKMSDDLLAEFNIANYSFRVVFAPIHCGTLYAEEGWNLAMSIDRIFQSPVYTGAVLVCAGAHIGVMKKGYRMYAWWFIKRTKKIRVIVSEDMKDYIKLIVKEINQAKEVAFILRIVTISYAKMIGPNCSDIEGLHEFMMPSTSIAEIHRKHTEDYDLAAVFRPIDQSIKASFVLGTVALEERDCVTEPLVQRCYFVALLAVMLKRDIIQNPLPGMIDKVLELAENLYKLFEEPKYHTEHILKDVSLMSRVFDFRDCASKLVILQGKKGSLDRNFSNTVKKHLKAYFKNNTSGIVQFSNCCYAFWYSNATLRYYYLDPYQCDSRGRRVHVCGSCCLCVFTTICDMVKQMCINLFHETTGFFIHRVHVESVDSSPFEKFREDPIWTYLDYHWSYAHLDKRKAKDKKSKEAMANGKESKKPKWKGYLIEVPNMIYSAWGSIGSLDLQFGSRASKNQAAIGVAALALQSLCHPSEWTAAALDSAVICGDEYYKDSRKSSTQCLNRFSLLECLKVPPYLWSIEFTSDICGVLYGSSEQPTLADSLAYAFTRLPNLIVQCKRKIVTIIKTSDAFYAIDSAWSGPPLFSTGRGAIYSIRCKNMNTLVYVVTKMLNTNQPLEFTITPVKLLFKQETCTSSDAKPKLEIKIILDKPVYVVPGWVVDYPCLVTGNVAVAEEDSYLCYCRNLKLGLEHGKEYEAALGYSPDEHDHSNVKKSAKKRQGDKKASLNLRETKGSCEVLRGLRAEIKGLSSMLERNVEYPQIINFVDVSDSDSELGQCPRMKPCTKKAKVETNYCRPKAYKLAIDKSSSGKTPLDVRDSFVREETREVYDNYNEEMKNEIYKNRKHNIAGQSKLFEGQESLAEMSLSVVSSSVEGDGEQTGGKSK